MANILTGGNGTRLRRQPTGEPQGDPHSQAGMQAMMREVGRMNTELQAATASLETATRALEAERARTEELHARLATEAGMRDRHAADMTAAKASIGALERELKGLQAKLGEIQVEHAATMSALEGANRQAAKDREFAASALAALARVEKSLAALAERPAPKAQEAPAYDMVVTARDVNLRPQRVRLTPRKE